MFRNRTAFPIDKSRFKTLLRIHPLLLKDPKAFVRKADLPVRTIKPHTLSRGGMSGQGLSIDLLTYGGIKMEIKKHSAEALSEVTVHFNPGKVLYGHNGGITTWNDVMDAMNLYVSHAKHLLENPDDWQDLIPGLRSGGPAFWDFLEILKHCNDPDGKYLAALRHLRLLSIKTPSRHWLDSIEVGGKRSNLQLSIYRKCLEMLDHGVLSEIPPQFADILRLEARLKGKKLVHYLGNADNVEVIDGKQRVVRFSGGMIIQAHRTIFSELKGVWKENDGIPEEAGQLAPLGRMIAQTAMDPRGKLTFPELMRQIAFYTQFDSTGDTIRNIRDAGEREIVRLGGLCFNTMFSDAAYHSQPSITVEEIESKVTHRWEGIPRLPLIEAAYNP